MVSGRQRARLEVRFEEGQLANEPLLARSSGECRRRGDAGPHAARVLRAQRRHVLQHVLLCNRTFAALHDDS